MLYISCPIIVLNMYIDEEIIGFVLKDASARHIFSDLPFLHTKMHKP